MCGSNFNETDVIRENVIILNKKVWEPENKLKSKKEPENSDQKSYMKNQKLKEEDQILESDEKNEEKVLISNKNFNINKWWKHTYISTGMNGKKL